MAHKLSLVLSLSTVLVSAQSGSGPGSGEWQFGDPADHGLDADAVRQAATAIDEGIIGRQCFMLIKDGKIMHEEYYRGHTVNSTTSAHSVTKSFGSTLVGIAQGQGYLDVMEPVAQYAEPSSSIQKDALIDHVLSQCAQSEDCSTFFYDSSSRINNLDSVMRGATGMGAHEYWMREFHPKMGFSADLEWPRRLDGGLNFGTSMQASCRDLARLGQLWLNEGEWDGEQLVDRDFIDKGSRPTHDWRAWGGLQYGYLVWQQFPEDHPFWFDPDPRVFTFDGLFGQCVHVSPEDGTVLVSMGNGSPVGPCHRSWNIARDFIRL